MTNAARRAREARRKVLNAGLLACYEIIDRIRRELAELAAADSQEKLES